MNRFAIPMVFTALVLVAYAAANVFAWDPFASSTETRELPPDVNVHDHRGGGAVFWYGGFSGGK